MAWLENCEYTDRNGFTIKYCLYEPELILQQKCPLIIHLHGAGHWGRGDVPQTGIGVQAKRLVRHEYPAYILAPLTHYPMKWVDLDWRLSDHRQPEYPGKSLTASYELLLHMIDQTPEIDKTRIYANGQSMGGFGCWDLITRWPDTFAAAILVCGGGDCEKMSRLINLPLWIFHGAVDDIVPVVNSRILVNSLRKEGHADYRYTEYPEVAHNSWEPAYDDEELWRWLYSQKKV